ncbi:hypothetical protein B9Z19DRAFT_966907, partial [Tuber borchii]
TNTDMPEDEHTRISFTCGARNVVLTGSLQSLYGLNFSPRKVKAQTGSDQDPIPLTKRKVSFTNSFLPIPAPFYSPYLESAV